MKRRTTEKMKYLPVLFGYHATGVGNSHVPLSLCRNWAGSGRGVRLYVPSAEDGVDYPWVITAMGGLKKKLVYRFGSDEAPARMTERLFLEREGQSPLVYLWAGLSLDIFRQCREAGAKIVVERINCHQTTARRIVLEAGERYGLDPGTVYTPESLEEERQKLAVCEAIFCPSPMVRASMIENGVPAEKLLDTSYGWEPTRFPMHGAEKPKNDRPVFLFAGTLCLRKGIPLLLDAWEKADLDAELLLLGGIDPAFEAYLQPRLHGKNIRHVPYTREIGTYFNRADVFVFPTLEEGGPMVTYEAMAHRVPPLVTAMGGGAIVRDGRDGVILSDDDVSAWAEAMTAMVADRAKARELGEEAEKRAMEFTWDRVAARRARLLEEKFPGLWAGRNAEGS